MNVIHFRVVIVDCLLMIKVRLNMYLPQRFTSCKQVNIKKRKRTSKEKYT